MEIYAQLIFESSCIFNLVEENTYRVCRRISTWFVKEKSLDKLSLFRFDEESVASIADRNPDETSTSVCRAVSSERCFHRVKSVHSTKSYRTIPSREAFRDSSWTRLADNLDAAFPERSPTVPSKVYESCLETLSRDIVACFTYRTKRSKQSHSILIFPSYEESLTTGKMKKKKRKNVKLGTNVFYVVVMTEQFLFPVEQWHHRHVIDY